MNALSSSVYHMTCIHWYIVGSEGRQSVKPTKGYSIWKSTDGVFRRKKSILHQKATRDATAEEKYEHEDDVMKRISPPSVEIRALSYSDILKSKPNIQVR